MARQRCYTKPKKSRYECPVCRKPLEIRRCNNPKYVMYGCKYVECKDHATPYEGWPKRFQWVTNWYHAGDRAQSPPLYPSALPLTTPRQLQVSREGAAGSSTAGRDTRRPVVVIDLTTPEGSTYFNPIVL
ncbi:hypothetical protein C8T65DRAFT_738560 [Cerioporus squamosus]|nr:hypothetical protein C8T65DRAFT_738560 [Cerioporus squamosus]